MYETYQLIVSSIDVSPTTTYRIKCICCDKIEQEKKDDIYRKIDEENFLTKVDKQGWRYVEEISVNEISGEVCPRCVAREAWLKH